MMKFLIRSFIWGSVAILCGSANAQVTRVLFIGNSYIYTNDLPSVFTQFALGMGDTVVVASSTAGGYTLQLHSTYAPTLAAIGAQPWDFVVIQEQSQLPSFPPAQVATNVLPYAQALTDSARAHNPCPEVVFMMTWGRENGDAGNCATWPPVCTYEGMQLQLRAGYLTMAQQNSAWCAPVGMVWRDVRTIAPGVPLYIADGSHPNINGTYVAASTLYSTLFRAACDVNPYSAGIDSATAALIRNRAGAIVLDSTDTWNIGVNDPNAWFSLFYTFPANGEVTFGPDAWPGTHAWLFGDGSSSTAVQPVHTYSASGSYTAWHFLTDSCGRIDSASLEVNVSITSVEEAVASDELTVAMEHGRLLLTSTRLLSGWFQVFDPTGRSLLGKRIDTTVGTQSLSFPIEATAVCWRFQPDHGAVRSGRAIFTARP